MENDGSSMAGNDSNQQGTDTAIVPAAPPAPTATPASPPTSYDEQSATAIATTVPPPPSYDGSSKTPKRKPGRPSNAELAARKAAQKTEAELKAQAKEGDLDEIMDQARRRIKQALPNATAQQAATVYGIIYDKRFKNTNGATADLQLVVKDEDRDTVLAGLLGRQKERGQSAPSPSDSPKPGIQSNTGLELASDTTQ